MTLSRWSREIEKAITRTLKTYERKEFFKVCRTKESHECLLGIVSAQNRYQNNGVASWNLCTVAYTWALSVEKCFLLSTCIPFTRHHPRLALTTPFCIYSVTEISSLSLHGSVVTFSHLCGLHNPFKKIFPYSLRIP